MKNLKFILFVLLASVLSAHAQPVDKKKIKFDESFNPLILNDDDIVVVPKGTGNDQQTNVVTGGSPNSNNEAIDSTAMILGYRIQVYTSTNHETAQEIKEGTESTFEDANVYLVYETPNYKIRIGDFTARFDAEDQLDIALKRGYRDAWIVKTKVFKYPKKTNPEN